MKLKSTFGALLSAAALAAGSIVAVGTTAAADTGAAPAEAVTRELRVDAAASPDALTPIGTTLCANMTARGCGISVPAAATISGIQQGAPFSVNVQGSPNVTVSVAAFAVRWDAQGESFTVARVSPAVSLKLDAYGYNRTSLTVASIPAGYDGGQVLIQPSDYRAGDSVIPASSLSDDGEPQVIQVRSDRARDMGFAETGSWVDVFHRRADAAIPGHRYSVQVLRGGTWVTIDNAGPATVGSQGTVSVQARVPKDLPTGKYRTRLVNVTKGITDISPDYGYTYFTWTYSAPSKPTDPGFDVYTTPGLWDYNGRKWRTSCEDYSQTERCRTEIWASVITYANGRFTQTNGYAFNNLTYKPSSRTLWKTNYLGGLGQRGFNQAWTKDGRQWRTECDTALSGSNGCRAWTMTSVAEVNPAGGYRVVNKWVFNNIVKFN